MAQKIGIGIIGTGFGQIVHIPGFQAHPDTEVVAVYHRRLDKAQQIADKFGIPHSYTNLGDLLAIPDVQAVSISTPPFLHFEAAKAAIAAGKHVLLEKPTTLNVDEAIALYKLAQNKGTIVTMDFEFRTCPHWCYLKDLMAQGYAGKTRLITIDWLVQGRADAKRAWNWYSQKARGGGALGALGSHTFDYVDWLFGPISRLCGQLSTAIPTRPDVNGVLHPVDADDTCNIMLELADGTPCNICISTVTYSGRGHWVTVYGDRATLVLGSPNLADYVHGFSLRQAKPGGELEVMPIPSEYEFPQTFKDGRLAPFIAICDRFVAAIRKGESIAPGLKEGIYSQLLMDLTHLSHAQRQWVDVPSLDSVIA
ncbi:Gfo/Idh/MocA family protein [Pseudanabaena sp. PCC 6802]|uniref:Gfo/Idh/MocA family protein n=1 Tax=Pseudanabaena sp. PCC 6802 TaxID=118173 RepID=UPI00034C25E1|nr:Gfo/Idh/MocA family oxidoreductase [Pseudanabaena sp. PCC 6802]